MAIQLLVKKVTEFPLKKSPQNATEFTIQKAPQKDFPAHFLPTELGQEMQYWKKPFNSTATDVFTVILVD